MNDAEMKEIAEAWPKCKRADWMMWLLCKTGADTQKICLAALDIAETVLPIWEAWSQTREPHEAIDAARRYLAEPTDENLAAADAADAAARAASDAAARAASDAAAAADAARVAWAAAAKAAADRPDILRAQADIVRRYFPKAPKAPKVRI